MKPTTRCLVGPGGRGPVFLFELLPLRYAIVRMIVAECVNIDNEHPRSLAHLRPDQRSRPLRPPLADQLLISRGVLAAMAGQRSLEVLLNAAIGNVLGCRLGRYHGNPEPRIDEGDLNR